LEGLEIVILLGDASKYSKRGAHDKTFDLSLVLDIASVNAYGNKDNVTDVTVFLSVHL